MCCWADVRDADLTTRERQAQTWLILPDITTISSWLLDHSDARITRDCGDELSDRRSRRLAGSRAVLGGRTLLPVVRWSGQLEWGCSHLRTWVPPGVTDHVTADLAFMPAEPLGCFGDGIGLGRSQGRAIALHTPDANARLEQAETQAGEMTRVYALHRVGNSPGGKKGLAGLVLVSHGALRWCRSSLNHGGSHAILGRLGRFG